MSKPSIWPGDRVAGAEQQRVGRDARDEAAALLDRAHGSCRTASGRGSAWGRRRVRLQAVRGHDVGARRRGRRASATVPRWATVRARGRRRRVQGRRVVDPGRRAGPDAQAGGQHGDDGERAPLPAAHRYSSSRSETPHQAQAAATRPSQQPERTGDRQPPAGVVELLRGLAAQGGQLRRRSSCRTRRRWCCPCRSRCPSRARPHPPSPRTSSSARICWWTAAYVGPRQRGQVGGRRVLPELGELGGDGRGRGLPGLLERGARTAGDEGEALVRLGVEPGDPGLGRGQRGGVDAVAGGVDVRLDRQQPDRADHQRHEHHQRGGREREVDVAPGPSGQPDQGEAEHEQGEQARDDEPQGGPAGPVELLGRRGRCWPHRGS